MYYLRSDNVRRILDQRHLTHQQFARQLGISSGYWSRLLQRRRHLTVPMRQRLLRCESLAGVSETELWERI